MQIRKFKSDDARKVFYLIRKTLFEVNSKDYSLPLLENMARHYRPTRLIEMSNHRKIFVVTEGNQILATGAIADNWILSFFVNPRVHGQGIGTRLLNHLESLAVKRGHTHTFIPAGFTAIGFYEKCGYKRADDQSNATENWIIMEKPLSQS